MYHGWQHKVVGWLWVALMPKGGKLFGYDTRGRIVMRDNDGEWRLEQDKATLAWAWVRP
jgi:hypothetical protein